MRVAFFASDPIAIPAMEFLRGSKNFPLACVVSNPDKPQGRGAKVKPNAVSEWAINCGVELLRPEKPDDACVARLRELGAELIVVMAYGHILKKNILEYSDLPCLNLHASILPELRGASPIETAIALNYKETGVSLMKIVPRMDAGPVCATEKIFTDSRETAHSLREKVSLAAAELLEKYISDVACGAAKFVEQDESRATYTRKHDKEDARLNFFESAENVDARVRAFGAGIFSYKGEDIKVSEPSFDVSRPCGAREGEVLEASVSAGLRVACKIGSVCFRKIQRPCAKMLDASEFFKGYKIENGEVLKSFENKNFLK